MMNATVNVTENPYKHKHLTLDDRSTMQVGLTQAFTFKVIAEQIGKSPSTVSREIETHMHEHHSGYSRIDDI